MPSDAVLATLWTHAPLEEYRRAHEGRAYESMDRVRANTLALVLADRAEHLGLAWLPAEPTGDGG